jgi:two-component system, chemotaxis family, sensor kinase CheA
VSELDDELTRIFRDEAAGRLDQMEAALLAVEAGGAGVESVDSLFRNAHTIKGAAGMLGLDDLCALARAVEGVLAGVRDAGEFRPGLAAPLLRATAALRAQVSGAQEPVDELLDDLAASAAVLAGGARGAAECAALPAPGMPAPGMPGPGMPATVLPRPEPGSAAPGPRTQRPLSVPADKIDRLLDVVGEVVQYRGRLAHSLGTQALHSQEVADVLDGSKRMLDELKHTAIGLRTLPLETITRRLPLAVRDLARTAGKEVELVVTGAGTEIDRVILESLYDPLAHLLRNAVSHGIESPPERARAQKPSCGRLEVRALPRGSLVEIVVADDGSGVSPEVAERARHEGSLGDVLAQAGYSTAREVTDLAGRGVGLDAVRSYAWSVGGSFEVRSEPGLGMEVVLLLPLALALLEVLLFERGEAVYGVPLVAVEEVVFVTETLTLEGRAALAVRGRPLPVADVAMLIGTAPPSPRNVPPALGNRPPALVISAGGRRCVATCDAVIGKEEVVVKPLGPLFGGIEGYLGAAILGDGRIALLVEPAMLTRGARHAQKPAAPRAAGPGEARPTAAPRVLVVEDSFTVRELQRSILEAAGYPVVTARDGRDALAVLHGDPEIALVVTDLEMPELDGLELTRAIRASQACSSLPVVIVTSRGSEEDRRKGIEAGADAYMVKLAFDQQALLTTVERLVGR